MKSDIGLIQRYSYIINWVSIITIFMSAVMIVEATDVEASITFLTERIDGWGVWAPLVYAMLYVTASVVAIPGSILTVVAGAVFGLWYGFLAAWLSSTAGAMAAFLVSRYIARDWVARWLSQRIPQFAAVDRAIGEEGWKIVVMLRLSPATPFNLQNYLYGLTRIRFWPCLGATWIGMIPGTFLYVYLGHIAGTAMTHRSMGRLHWLLLILGIAVTCMFMIYIAILVRRRLLTISATQEPHAPPATNVGFRGDNRKLTKAQLVRTVMTLLVAVAAVFAAVYVHRQSRVDNPHTSMINLNSLVAGAASAAQHG